MHAAAAAAAAALLLCVCCAVIAAGYYLPPGSSAAVACPQGTFKSQPGAATSCTACPGGVVTEAQGSTSIDNCTVLMPGMYAAAMNGTAVMVAKQCPQKFYCQGGVPKAAVDPANLAALGPEETTITACPDGTWTQGLEAAAVEECCKSQLLAALSAQRVRVFTCPCFTQNCACC